MNEPKIAINGKELTEKQAHAVRVAVESASYNSQLQPEERELLEAVISVIQGGQMRGTA
jgi:hypothetical protein